MLGEVVLAYTYEMIDRDVLLKFLRNAGQEREVGLTGRDPAPELMELADYVTEMRKVKHPFDSGTAARKGIEY